MPKANEFKKGMVLEIDSIPHSVKTVEAQNPSARGAATLYKVRFTNLMTKQKLDQVFKGDDLLKEADCMRLPVQYSYNDGERYAFMNLEDFSQYEINADDIEAQIPYLLEGLEDITALLVEGNLVAIDLPQNVIMEIVDTAPAIKGASATSRTKPATLTTGLEVQVPEYLAVGEAIKINTETGKFMQRA